MIRFNDIKIYDDLTDEEIVRYLCKKKKLFRENINKWYIRKKSIDARDKKNVHYIYTIDLEYDGEYDVKGCIHVDDEKIDPIKVNRKSDKRPIVIGSGPAGLFAALTLIDNGIKPIIFEQGDKVEERTKKVEYFQNKRILDVNSNVQFGEGGAGTFSDGKLTTGINSAYCREVINTFYKFGAPKEITYMAKPHIGTDNLVNIIRNIREYIIAKGGEYHFNEKIIDFYIEDNKIIGVQGKEKYDTDSVILAIGHSARSTFTKLYNLGLEMEQKAFSVGVRIEHKQEMINESQYGEYTKLKLPPAEYKLVYHGKDRSAYTFCMCPGGEVIASSSEENTIVTNGMSRYKRDGDNANAALLVNIVPSDYASDDPLSGLEFQKKLESKAFEFGGNNYNAPIQKVGDFLSNKKTTSLGSVTPTYKPGVTLSNLNNLFPRYISDTMKEALIYFDKKIKGYASEDAIMTGVETRSSSPVRIKRNENLESSVEGIYPCGEGPGYAGGIMSAAIDGIKCATKILEKE